MKNTCFKILFLVFFPVWLYGQDIEQQKFIQDKVREIVLEKLRVDPYQVNKSSQNIPVKLKMDNENSIETNGEMQVTSNSIPESEVYAVINPTDSNNIVLSPIRYKSFGDQLICPVIYSKDFGQTWNESSFRAVPPGPKITIAGGGDPVFAFDADGKLYFAWINLYVKDSIWSNGFWIMSWAYSNDGGAT